MFNAMLGQTIQNSFFHQACTALSICELQNFDLNFNYSLVTNKIYYILVVQGTRTIYPGALRLKGYQKGELMAAVCRKDEGARLNVVNQRLITLTLQTAGRLNFFPFLSFLSSFLSCILLLFPFCVFLDAAFFPLSTFLSSHSVAFLLFLAAEKEKKLFHS